MCDCNICKRSKTIDAIKNKLTDKEDIKYLEDLGDYILDLGFDNECLEHDKERILEFIKHKGLEEELRIFLYKHLIDVCQS